MQFGADLVKIGGCNIHILAKMLYWTVSGTVGMDGNFFTILSPKLIQVVNISVVHLQSVTTEFGARMAKFSTAHFSKEIFIH